MTLSILIAVLALGLAALAVLVALWLVFFPHAPEDLGGAENLDARAEPVRIPLPDGDALQGWWLQGAGRGTLLLLHGFGRTHARMWRYGGFLSEAGYGLLAVDFRSSRSRRRLPTTLGHHEIGEAQAALDWLRLRSAERGDPMAVMGESLGGSVALLLAARNPEIAAVVVLAFLEPPLRGAGAGLAGGVRASAVVRTPRSAPAPGVAPVQVIGKLAGLRGRRAHRAPAA